jgi:predicted oxidoreductase
VEFESALQSPGNAVPREHQPIGRGIGLVTPVFRACQEQPTVRFVWNTKIEQLLQHEGRVTGVVGRNVRTQEETRWEADAVILATGGFQNNLDMVREFWPAEFKFPEKIFIGSGRHSVGYGHKLAQEAGGELVRMDHQWNYFCGIPDPRYPGSNRGLNAANMHGILVNPDGKRFANLHGWAKIVMPPLLAQKKQTVWFIFDAASKPNFHVSGTDWSDFRKVDREILQNPSLVHVADTLEELAEKSGLPAENLAATVKRWNELVDQGVDDDFGRFGPQANDYSNGASPKIVTPPFYAMQTWPLTRKSMGGVAINRACQVIDKDQAVIPGLYAVGELTGLAGINGKAALEGTFLGPCIVTGRVAAQSILKTLPDVPAPSELQAASRCSECHDIGAEIAEKRPGFWHFEAVQRTVLDRGTDCRICHSDLIPYDETRHHIHLPTLTTTCVQCHTARE